MRLLSIGVIWAAALFSSSSGKPCFYDHNLDGFGATQDGIDDRTLANLTDDCTSVPSVTIIDPAEDVFDPNHTVPSFVSLQKVGLIDQGYFAISGVPNLFAITAGSFSRMLPKQGEFTNFFTVDNLPNLTLFQVAPEGINAENISLTIADTGLKEIPAFSAKNMVLTAIERNPELSILEMGNVESIGELRLSGGGSGLHTSFAKLKSVGGLGSYVPALVPQDPDRTSNYSLKLGSGIVMFNTPNIEFIGGHTYLNGTDLDAFELPNTQIVGGIVFRNNEKLRSIKLGAPVASKDSNFTLVLMDNPLMEEINFGDIFAVPQSTRKRAGEVEFLGNVYLNGSISSVDTTGFKFSGTFRVSSTSKQFDCEKFKDSISITGDGFTCDSVSGSVSGDGTESKSSGSMTLSATASATPDPDDQAHENLILAATIPSVLAAFFLSWTVFFVVRRYRFMKREQAAVPNPPGPDGDDGVVGSPVLGGSTGQAKESRVAGSSPPPDIEMGYRHHSFTPTVDTPEHYYRTFNTPPPASKGKSTLRDIRDEYADEDDEIEDFYGRAVTSPGDLHHLRDADFEADDRSVSPVSSTAGYDPRSIQMMLASEDLPMTIDRRGANNNKPGGHTATLKNMVRRPSLQTNKSAKARKSTGDTELEEFYGVSSLPEQKVRPEGAKYVRKGSKGYGAPPRINSFKKKPLPVVPMPDMPVPALPAALAQHSRSQSRASRMS